MTASIHSLRFLPLSAGPPIDAVLSRRRPPIAEPAALDFEARRATSYAVSAAAAGMVGITDTDRINPLNLMRGCLGAA